MSRFSQADLDKMGLKENNDGTFSKPKTVLQPREIAQLKVVGKPEKKAKVIQLVYFNGMDIQDVYAKCEREGTIFIKGNVPSLKNSKQLFKNKTTGKTFITSSKYCKEYVKDSDIHWRLFKSRFLKMIEGKEKPYTIQLFFVREDRGAFDYINISQIIFDQMQAYEWIEKDDNRNVIPDFSCGFGYDPKLGGVIIKIL